MAAAIENDVVYSTAPGRPLKLDLYRPTGPSLHTAALLVHGGGWSRGSKDMLAEHCKQLAGMGFTALACEYRLTGEAPFPACIHDVKRAIRWTRAHAAELDFDPAKLCLEGHSAGAHLVLLAAGTPNDPRLDPPEGDEGVSAACSAVAAVYPPVLFYASGERPSGGLAARSLPGADESDETALLASPIEHVTAAFPHTMLLHGDADKVVPVSASRRFEERLRMVGGKVDLHVWSGLPHGFGSHARIRPMMMEMIGGFFRRTVAEPEAYAFPAQPAPAREPAPAN